MYDMLGHHRKFYFTRKIQIDRFKKQKVIRLYFIIVNGALTINFVSFNFCVAIYASIIVAAGTMVDQVKSDNRSSAGAEIAGSLYSLLNLANVLLVVSLTGIALCSLFINAAKTRKVKILRFDVFGAFVLVFISFLSGLASLSFVFFLISDISEWLAQNAPDQSCRQFFANPIPIEGVCIGAFPLVFAGFFLYMGGSFILVFKNR
jgi:hypothetical protein